MRLEWLKDVISIAETGSFSEAARRRNLTQSAFSRRVRQIEDHLGIELFDRSKKPVQMRPTTAEHLLTKRLAAGEREVARLTRKPDSKTGKRRPDNWSK